MPSPGCILSEYVLVVRSCISLLKHDNLRLQQNLHSQYPSTVPPNQPTPTRTTPSIQSCIGCVYENLEAHGLSIFKRNSTTQTSKKEHKAYSSKEPSNQGEQEGGQGEDTGADCDANIGTS